MRLPKNWRSSDIYQLESRLRRVMARHGYEPVDMPVLSSADIFLTRAGDKIIERLFTFEKRDRLFALRPEFTAVAAHRYVTGLLDELTPQNPPNAVRWFFSGPIFEDNPEDARHNYQEFSIGAELIGACGSIIDADVIRMAVDGLVEVGLNDWTLLIGHAGIQRYLLAQRFQLDSRTRSLILENRSALKNGEEGKSFILDQLRRILDSEGSALSSTPKEEELADTQPILDALLNSTRYSATIGGRTRHDIAARLLQKRQRMTEWPKVAAAIHFLEGWTNISAIPEQAFPHIEKLLGDDDPELAPMLTDWKQVVELLQATRIPSNRIRIEPDLARNWEYYTGIVFGIEAPDGTIVAGGGRYDELTRLLGSPQEIPAIGFAYYMDRLLRYLDPPESSPGATIYLVAQESNPAASLNWAGQIRRFDLPVALEAENPQQQGAIILSVNEDGTITFKSRMYQPDELETLIADLREIIA